MAQVVRKKLEKIYIIKTISISKSLFTLYNFITASDF